ncbi:MAG: hypothetical protein PHV68_05910 [Candidatus Gastranaerophilales bacterium]|nr:hypothetical protein [Candidatus Gastranaerophilales bacterium]
MGNNLTVRQKSSYTHYADARKFSKAKKQQASFGSVGLASQATAGFMQWMQNAGFVAEFTIQDMLGTNFPRTAKGLDRNREEIGHPNYAAATEAATREFLTGPSMFLIPMAVFAVTRKAFKEASFIHLNPLKRFGNNFEKTISSSTDDVLRNPAELKKSFYNDLLDNIFKTTFGEDFKINKKPFVNGFLKIEEEKDKLKNIKFYDRKAKKQVKSTIGEQVGIMQEIISKINKNNSNNFSDVYGVKLPFGDKINPYSMRFDSSFVDDVTKYSKDVVTKLSNNIATKADNITEKLSEYALKTVKNINLRRLGGRMISSPLALIGTCAFCSIIPNLYSRNEEFPGLDGLVKKNNQNTDKGVKFSGINTSSNAFDQFTKVKNKGGVK